MPDDAQALMRSRYCAYALGLAQYIIDTTDGSTAKNQRETETWLADILAFCESTAFRGLEVQDFSETDDEAIVQFHAVLNQNGKDASFTERSQFRRRNGKWYYSAGEIVR